jgi:hypothetical protein
VQHELHRLAVVRLRQTLELEQRPVERMVIRELHGAVQGNRPFATCAGAQRDDQAERGGRDSRTP